MKVKRTFKKLSDNDKFKKLYEQNLKKEYPKIEYLIKGNDKFAQELKEKYDSGKLIIVDPGKINLMYCISPNNEKAMTDTKYVKNFGISYRNNDKYLNYTNNARKKFIKHYEYIRHINNWKSRKFNNPEKLTLQDFENKLSDFNSKSCYNDKFISYCKIKIDSLRFFDKYYNSSLVNKLGWFTYLNKRRHYNDLIKLLKTSFIMILPLLWVIGVLKDKLNLCQLPTIV